MTEFHKCYFPYDEEVGYQHFCMEFAPGDAPEDGSWLWWYDKYGNCEKARMKYDAYDHFFPNTKVIKSEFDVIGWSFDRIPWDQIPKEDIEEVCGKIVASQKENPLK